MIDHDDPTATMSDADWAAEMATHALTRGRIELGYQLAKVAVQAHRHERAQAAKTGLFGDPDRSQPIPYVPAYTFDRLHQTNPIDAAAVGIAPVDTPLCDVHGQPMLAGPVDDAGKHEWLCICTLGGVDQRPKPDPEPAPAPDAAQPTAQGRCAAEIVHIRGTEQYREPCRGALYWVPDGSNQNNGTWRHIDPAIDDQHIPII